MLNNDLINKDLDMIPEQSALIILYRKPAVITVKNGKDTKHTIHSSRIINFVVNGEECNLHNTLWCEGGLKLSYIGTNNVREDELNPRLLYALVRIYN